MAAIIALTGASSTGKTTFANVLVNLRHCSHVPTLRLHVDARRLMREAGLSGLDSFTRDQHCAFQRLVFAEKARMETPYTSFITERSFVDIAAFWMLGCMPDMATPENRFFLEQCRLKASRYSLHVYFPLGLIPFQPDGYRNSNYEWNQKASSLILTLLKEWALRVHYITTANWIAEAQQVEAQLAETSLE